MYWKKATGEDINNSDDNELTSRSKVSKVIESLKYINPTLQMAKEVEEMREKKKVTSILRKDFKTEY